MVVNFEQVGVNVADYNGVPAQLAEHCIISRVADHLKIRALVARQPELADLSTLDADFCNTCDSEFFAHYDWQVDFVTQRVTIPADALH